MSASKPSTSLSVTSLVMLLFLNLSQLPGGGCNEEHIEVAFKEVTLKDVCANRQVPIVSVEVALKMISQLMAEPEICPESYRQSFYELQPVLLLAKGERVCTEKKFKEIVEYHFRYVNPKVETYKMGDNLDHLNKEIRKESLHADKFDYHVQLDDFNQEILIPIALQQFFKSWALQASGLCKIALVDNLERALQTSMANEDLNLIATILPVGGATRDIVNPVTGQPLEGLSFSGIVYLPELEGRRPDDSRPAIGGSVVLDFTQQPEVDRFMHACLLRFKPIYSKLIMPIVRLAKLGYDYMGPKIDSVSLKLERDPEVKRWMALTSICESHGDYELVETDESKRKLAAGLTERQLQPVAYEPTVGYGLEGEMWIKGAEALQRELDRIKGEKSTGWRKFTFKLKKGTKRAVAAIDPHQFAWYRRNQNTVANGLNSASILWNMISVGSTVTSWVAAGGIGR